MRQNPHHHHHHQTNNFHEYSIHSISLTENLKMQFATKKVSNIGKVLLLLPGNSHQRIRVLFKDVNEYNRCYSSYIKESGEVVNLSYSIFNPEKASFSTPILIMHGLLGSKQNWRGLGKAIAIKTNRKVYTLDARNHGDSEHSENFSYPLMSEDVKHFMLSHEIPKAVFMGHSMGGRTAMNIALTSKNLVEKLVVVDVSPIQLPQDSDSSLDYMKSMLKALDSIQNLSLVKARKAIDEYLSTTITDQSIRQFLLTNLTEKNKTVMWKPNMKALLNCFESGIVKFPESLEYYPGDTLFICGGNSPYIRAEDHPQIRALFPKAEFSTIPDAGHWVHSERPSEFLQALYNFL